MRAALQSLRASSSLLYSTSEYSRTCLPATRTGCASSFLAAELRVVFHALPVRRFLGRDATLPVLASPLVEHDRREPEVQEASADACEDEPHENRNEQRQQRSFLVREHRDRHGSEPHQHE